MSRRNALASGLLLAVLAGTALAQSPPATGVAQPAPASAPARLEDEAARLRTEHALRQAETVAWIRSEVPASLRGPTFAGLEAWQWIGLVALLVAGLVLSALINRVLCALLRRMSRREDALPGAESVARAARPFGLAAAALLWHAALPMTGVTGSALAALLGAARLFGIVMAGWAAFRIADFIAAGLARRAATTESKLDDLLVPLVRKTMKGAAILVAALYVLQGLGLAIGPLIASVGIGGLAVAFAAKDTIENFFGSLAVIFDRPFEVGDTIRVGDVEGEVLEVGFRSTRLRTPASSIVTLPNATLVRATVERIADRRLQPVSWTLRLEPWTPRDQVDALLAGLRDLVREHPATRKDKYEVRLEGFGEWSLDVLVRVYFETPDASGELRERERERLLLDSLDLLRRLGLRLAAAPGTAGILPAPG